MQDISKKIIQVIEDQQLKPKPRWQFLLKNYFLWSLTVITIILGALATGVVLFELTHSQYLDLAPNFGLAKRLILATPFFWLILLILFIAISYYNVRHTQKGYRYHTYWIVIFSILFSIFLGAIFYVSGGGEKLEDFFYQKIPIYRQIVHRQVRVWQSPEQGRLIGWIISQPEIDSFLLKDFNLNTWMVITESPLPSKLPYNARIIVTGERLGHQEFLAKEIMPLFKIEHKLNCMKGNNCLMRN